MIAPIDKSTRRAGGKTRTLHSARRAVASVLFDAECRADQPAEPITRWQAWLFVAWAGITAGAYFWQMLGFFD